AEQADRPAKRAKLLDEDSESEVEEQLDAGAVLRVNEEYARRFEHNKKREERHRLEEKYGKADTVTKGIDAEGEDSDGSSSDETEDAEGFLATEKADAELQAIL